MNTSCTFQPSSQAENRLVDLISNVRYGVIRNLRIERGQPVFNPAPEVVRNIKFGAKDGHDAKLNAPKLHKEQMAELFDAIAEIGDGCVESLEVQAGLPFRLNVSYACQF